VIFRCFPLTKLLQERRKTDTYICRFRYGRLSRTVLSLLLPILPILPALAQDEESVVSPDEPAVVETIERLTPDEPAVVETIERLTPDEPAVVERIERMAPVLYESDKLRDPFLHLTPPKTSAVKAEDEEVPRGAPPAGIEGTYIANAGFEGIVVRSGDRRVAIIRSSDNRAFLLREGDRLFDGYIKTIEFESGSVVFVRETLMRSGIIQTQEVTKRLREL